MFARGVFKLGARKLPPHAGVRNHNHTNNNHNSIDNNSENDRNSNNITKNKINDKKSDNSENYI